MRYYSTRLSVNDSPCDVVLLTATLSLDETRRLLVRLLLKDKVVGKFLNKRKTRVGLITRKVPLGEWIAQSTLSNARILE